MTQRFQSLVYTSRLMFVVLFAYLSGSLKSPSDSLKRGSCLIVGR